MADTYYIATGADDGIWLSGIDSSDANHLYIGDTGGGGIGAYLRFTNITIPKNASIFTAVLKVYSGYNMSSALPISIWFVAADDPGQPSSPTDLTGSKTSVATWNPDAWTADTQYTSADIYAPLQEIVNRAGWASGQDMIVCLQSDDADWRTIRPYEYSSGTKKAELNVSWGIKTNVPASDFGATFNTPSGFANSAVPASDFSASFLAPSQKISALVPPADFSISFVAPSIRVLHNVPLTNFEATFLAPTQIGLKPNSYRREPAITGKHLSLKFQNNTLNSGLILYHCRFKMTKQDYRTFDVQDIGAQATHLTLKIQGDGNPLVLEYMSMLMEPVIY